MVNENGERVVINQIVIIIIWFIIADGTAQAANTGITLMRLSTEEFGKVYVKRNLKAREAKGKRCCEQMEEM